MFVRAARPGAVKVTISLPCVELARTMRPVGRRIELVMLLPGLEWKLMFAGHLARAGASCCHDLAPQAIWQSQLVSFVWRYGESGALQGHTLQALAELISKSYALQGGWEN